MCDNAFCRLERRMQHTRNLPVQVRVAVIAYGHIVGVAQGGFGHAQDRLESAAGNRKHALLARRAVPLTRPQLACHPAMHTRRSQDEKR